MGMISASPQGLLGLKTGRAWLSYWKPKALLTTSDGQQLVPFEARDDSITEVFNLFASPFLPVHQHGHKLHLPALLQDRFDRRDGRITASHDIIYYHHRISRFEVAFD